MSLFNTCIVAVTRCRTNKRPRLLYLRFTFCFMARAACYGVGFMRILPISCTYFKYVKYELYRLSD